MFGSLIFLAPLEKNASHGSAGHLPAGDSRTLQHPVTAPEANGREVGGPDLRKTFPKDDVLE